MTAIKPIKLYFHGPSPNPWKVVIILEELNLPYELISIGDVKAPWYLDINPNGRAPSMEDPNTGVTTWESGSNIEYLVDVYDKEHKISHASSPGRYLENNWKHFQMSGQGPYFGQKAWFTRYHPEKIQSAIDRYSNEIKRVLGVIDLHLTKTGQTYLTGNEVSYVDLMFVPWNDLVTGMLLDEAFAEEWKEKYPKCFDWHQRLGERDSVQKMKAVRKEKTGYS